jgi:AraC-like DNA-binding protein
MPSSAVQTFTDPDDYTSAVRATNAEMTIVGRGSFHAKLIHIDLDHVWVRRYADNLPRIVHSNDEPGYATISFRTQPGPSLRKNSLEMLQSNIIRCGQADTYYHQSDGQAYFGSVTLPVQDMAAVGAAIVGRNLEPLKDAVSITPSPLALDRLLRLHEAVGTLAEDAPAVIAHPEAARGLEQALIEAMMDCLGGAETYEDRAAMRRHALIMRRFHSAIERHLDEPLYIPELCKEIGTSLRTLNACCQEHLGMGPKHYLLLRRMILFRRALRAGNPAETTVTETATRYGFWQFGRLAVEYRALFGEVPSATLARPRKLNGIAGA